MRVDVVEQLGDLAPAWDELVDRQAMPSAFLRSWWLGAAAAGRPQVVCCFDGDELVGGAAFEVDAIGRGGTGLERVRSLGQGPLAPDHLDVVAAPGRRAEVAREVLGWLRRPGSRLVDLDGLAATGALARVLSRHEMTRTGAPFSPLPADLDAYLADRPGQLRSTISRTRKRMVKAGATIRRVGPDDADRALADLARLHDHRWADDSGFLDAWDRFERAARAGLQDGSVVVHEAVDADGQVVATELDVRAATSIAFYQAGRSTDREWRGVGSVLKADVVGWAIEHGATEYDLLRGDEAYKSDWATDRREVVRVRFGSGTAGRAVAVAATAWFRARSVQVAASAELARRRAERDEPSAEA
ncbi:GNAT family N-acetyltransferase [Dermatobacter hominis]|uniref:GNAT family N-acetyltransferase n=1 Tax=Dermatobacter hominis TaxID=2884263 RepID=UPI001D10D48F|nr:GNAT family N-acetyltransferase [Dermatobacter hominis]UDY37704.1 GNAT family N-acetyltransferase [Dermatobacter hominis]